MIKANLRVKRFLLVAALFVVAVVAGWHAYGPNAVPSSGPARVHTLYGKVEMAFEENRGQTDAAVNYIARGAGYTLFLKPGEAIFALRGNLASETADVLRMQVVGANPGSTAKGTSELEGKANYFTGNDPSAWRTDIPTFAAVRYADVYPGIDVLYYGDQQRLEYDFVVRPNREVSAIELRFDGAKGVSVDPNGDLVLSVGSGTIRQPKPFVYQDIAANRIPVDGTYVVKENGNVVFSVGDYDHSADLVIDPTIVYSTYLGGSGGDQGLHIAVDSAGSAYVVGFTGSTNFPTATPIQAANGGFDDAFVSKLNAAGNSLVYSTYLGGNGSEQGRGIAVDSAGNAYLTGVTNSTNFPTANAFDATIGSNGDDAFVTKVNAAGNALVYSTFLGGNDSAEFGQAITVDSAGAAYVTGNTFSNDFPTVNPIQAAKGGGSTDAFLSKLNAAGSALVYSTYLGGNDNDSGEGIKVDSAGNCYLGGDTFSTNFPTASPIQSTNGGNGDTFVLKVNAAGNALVYSTYLGGSARDALEDLAIDSGGNVYTTGDTESSNFPTANAFQAANGGTTLAQDAFVTKTNAAGNALVFSTYLGGTGGEIGFGIAVDAAGSVYVAGVTGSNTSFPRANAIQCSRAGSSDVTITKFNPAGSALVYSTYFGGTDDDQARGIAIDSSGNAYIAGKTSSANYPTVNAFQSTFGGETAPFGDAFLLKLNDAIAPNSCGVTAATVSVSGRLRTWDGRGIRNARVTLTDAAGNTRAVVTGRLGVYRFDNVVTGETYLLNAAARRFPFVEPAIVITVSDELAGLDFIASSPGRGGRILVEGSRKPNRPALRAMPAEVAIEPSN